MLLILSHNWVRKYRVQLEISLLAYELLQTELEVAWTALSTMKTLAYSLGKIVQFLRKLRPSLTNKFIISII